MKANVGDIVQKKVSGRVVPVQITISYVNGGYRGRNLATNKIVHIKSDKAIRGISFRKNKK